MRTTTIAGWLLIAGAAGVLIPYTLLTMNFDYPDVLRQDPGSILLKFNAGGGRLIATWLTFALLGLPLIPAYKLIGQQWGNRSRLIPVATTIGIAGLVVQMIGLLRWTFVVPVLADNYIHATNETEREIAITAFQIVHQFAGVLLGEHLGQLFTIIWTVLLSVAFIRTKLMPQWVGWLGILSGLVYSIAQADLLDTVMPGVLIWEPAGFIGSTLWLIWLVIVGIFLLRTKKENT